MSDSRYPDFFRDDPFLIKEESDVSEDTFSSSSTPCVPIPMRRLMDMSQMRDNNSLSYGSTSPLMIQDNEIYDTFSSSMLWSPRMSNPDPDLDITKMDDDDIFQVDKSDLIQGSNLTSINPNQDILDDLNFDEIMLPNEFNCIINVPNFGKLSPDSHQLTTTPASSFASSYGSSFHTTDGGLSAYSQDHPDSLSLTSSPVNSTGNNARTYLSLEPNKGSSFLLSPTQNSRGSLHELLLTKRDPFLMSPEPQVLGQSVPGSSTLIAHSKRNSSSRGNTSSSSRLSSSAPTHLGLDQIWQRREPRKHLLSTGSLAEASSISSVSTAGLLSPDGFDFSINDEPFDSDDDTDQEDEYSTDGESGSDNEGMHPRMGKKERYFWQYNVQSKGPKGQRLFTKTPLEDPHCLNEVTDPVFSADCSLQGIKHSGKARKGDGNDLTPNPKKLHAIGKELDKLNKIINDMTPVSELPFNVRPSTRKEKNKLASRACRLKKKAQHEANKIKLMGLESEHKRMLGCINQLKQAIVKKILPPAPDDDALKNVEKLVKHAGKLKVAGQTTEFVNKILERSRAGVPNGGLDEICSNVTH